MPDSEELEPQISENVPVTHTGTVVGRYIVGIVDGADADDEPDIIPAQGTFEFVPSVGYVSNPVADSPYTMIKDTIYGVLDSEGFLCTPDPYDNSKPGRRGVKLLATNSPGASVVNWVWKVTPKFVGTSGRRGSNIIPPFNIAVPSGETVDLTTVQKVPSSPGIGVEQAIALVASAQKAALAAEAAANSGKVTIDPDPLHEGLFIIRMDDNGGKLTISPDLANEGLFFVRTNI